MLYQELNALSQLLTLNYATDIATLQFNSNNEIVPISVTLNQPKYLHQKILQQTKQMLQEKVSLAYTHQLKINSKNA